MVEPRFPSTSSRQRSSNINISNAEQEFQKTALGACRSTISQQEIELKRLKESIDIRNKRITQLEAQVEHAGNLFAERNPERDFSENKIETVLDKLRDISAKIERHAGIPTNNIVVNSCNPWKPQQMISSATQTDPPELIGELVRHPAHAGARDHTQGQQDGRAEQDGGDWLDPELQSQHTL